MKKSIFTILITAMIVGSLGVYAGSKFSAKEISYVDKNNNEITVETALNNLYEFTGSNYCEKKTVLTNSQYATNTGVALFSFDPSIIIMTNQNGVTYVYNKTYVGSNNVAWVTKNYESGGFTKETIWTYRQDGKLYGHNFGSGDIGINETIIACK